MINTKNSDPADDSPPQCESCGTTEDVTFGPCPYASDIGNDDTDVHLCGECSAQRAADV